MAWWWYPIQTRYPITNTKRHGFQSWHPFFYFSTTKLQNIISTNSKQLVCQQTQVSIFIFLLVFDHFQSKWYKFSFMFWWGLTAHAFTCSFSKIFFFPHSFSFFFLIISNKVGKYLFIFKLIFFHKVHFTKHLLHFNFFVYFMLNLLFPPFWSVILSFPSMLMFFLN